MKSLILAVAALAAMSASSAWASTTTDFEDSGITGPFSDSFTFTTGAGSADISLSTSSSELSFTSVTFDGQPLTDVGTLGADTFYGLSGVGVSAGQQTVNVSGTFTGSTGSGGYDGTVTFTPVSGAPEPSSWALMILGVGMAGATLRLGRNRNSLALASK